MRQTIHLVVRHVQEEAGICYILTALQQDTVVSMLQLVRINHFFLLLALSFQLKIRAYMFMANDC